MRIVEYPYHSNDNPPYVAERIAARTSSATISQLLIMVTVAQDIDGRALDDRRDRSIRNYIF